MHTSHLSSLFQHEGPFATVQVDVGHGSENGEHEHALRVRSACERLREQGADGSVVDAVARVLMETVDRPAPVARLVVATRDGVQHDEVASLQLSDVTATWGPLPDLAPWIAHRDSAVTFVLALVDHEGGDVAVYDSDVPEPEEESSVGGEERFVHKVPVGGWSALRYQNNTENVWARNADAVVDEVTSHVRGGQRLVLLAGDPQSRGLVRAGLAELDAEVVELETGNRNEDGGDEALQQAIREALMEHAVARRLALTHELKDRLGQDNAVATGVRDVADAFVRGQVETLLIDADSAAELELDPREFEGLTLGSSTPDGPLRADLALISAAVLTNADVAVSPKAALGGAPVAALLRWDQQAVGSH